MLLKLNFNSDIPIYAQIRNGIVMGIATGKIAPGQQLPTVRALSDECGVNVMTVSKAYQSLKQEGYIEADRRSGTRVCCTNSKEISKENLDELRLKISELRLAGFSCEEILELCKKIYEEAEK